MVTPSKGGATADSFAIAVDIGGTFTDVVLRRRDGRVWIEKVLTTHHDLLDGFFQGVDVVMAAAGLVPAQVDDVLVHATTVVTNALLERKGPKTALITTEGFKDVLYIRDEYRYDMYDPQIEFPEPLVPSHLTFGVVERTLATGAVQKAVDVDEVRAIARNLTNEAVVSVAVCLINSYRNPRNERVIADILRAELPDLYISISSTVAPQIREYPRTSTCVINAYTAPISQPYLDRLSRQLAARGYKNKAMMMLSNGGIIGIETAGRFPVRMIESGPAAGALASSYFTKRLDIPKLLSFDMGGTTAKACVIEDRTPLVANSFEVARAYRFKHGSGFPVTLPSIDMIEIGAGGGSIAAVNDLGLLKVGPRSAGSMPGPVCYGRGGRDITVTDANLALGFLDADNFLGGDMKLDAAATTLQLDALSRSTGFAAAETAAGIYRLVGETMASAARAHAADRGVDARGIPVLAFGGAGPLHGCYLAELLGSATVIFPPNASVLSALGMLVTPARYDLVVSYLRNLDDIDWGEIETVLDGMVDEGTGALIDAGCARSDIRYTFGGDLRYHGQDDELSVTFAEDPRKRRTADHLRDRFEVAYETQYGLRLADNDVEIVSWRLVCQGGDVRRDTVFQSAASPGKSQGRRSIRLADTKQGLAYEIYARAALAVGQSVAGPALIVERETTAVILPNWIATLDPTGCVIARRR